MRGYRVAAFADAEGKSGSMKSLFRALLAGVGSVRRVLGKLGDAGVGEAHGPVDVMGQGLEDGAVVFAQAVEHGAQFE